MEENNNKKKKIGIVIFILSLLIILFFIIVPLSKKIFFSISDKTLKILRPDNIVLSFESIHSFELKENITYFITNYFQENKVDKIDLLDFSTQLKNKFDFIKNVEWNFSVPGNANLKIIGKQVVCWLNNQSVLAQDNSILDTKYFSEYTFTVTKELILEKDLSNKAFSFLSELPEHIWCNYKLDYKDKNNILLFAKLNNNKLNYNFLLDRKTIFDNKKLFLANKIFNDLYDDKKINLRKKYVLDLRYENKILLRNKKIER
ncbi:hypothetical protein L6269_02855 [Candidatus Dependentiae bacterium]|nr:hypothetical protein [Candidatus Dependentiae bacterium]MCG2756401.1 hypothetical protein [Candidatus Dependentiae bacterium]